MDAQMFDNVVAIFTGLMRKWSVYFMHRNLNIRTTQEDSWLFYYIKGNILLFRSAGPSFLPIKWDLAGGLKQNTEF